MKHERGLPSLWPKRMPLYPQGMAKALYNIRLLADGRLRKKRLDAFLDAYGASIDAYPVCRPLPYRRGADALWNDFARIANDTNNALNKNTKAIAKPDD